MKLKTFLAAVLCGMAILPAVSKAETDYWSGNYWLQVCSEPSTASTTCGMYAAGLAQGITAGVALAKRDAGASEAYRPYCTPSGVVIRQERDIFVRYLQAHPERRHEVAIVLFIEAMQEAFPCPSKK